MESVSREYLEGEDDIPYDMWWVLGYARPLGIVPPFYAMYMCPTIEQLWKIVGNFPWQVATIDVYDFELSVDDVIALGQGNTGELYFMCPIRWYEGETFDDINTRWQGKIEWA